MRSSGVCKKKTKKQQNPEVPDLLPRWHCAHWVRKQSPLAVYHAAVTACKSFCQWNWRFRAQISTFISWQLIRAEERTESFGCRVMERKNKRRCAPCRETQKWIKRTRTHTPGYSVNVSPCASVETCQNKCLTCVSSHLYKLYHGLRIPSRDGKHAYAQTQTHTQTHTHASFCAHVCPS